MRKWQIAVVAVVVVAVGVGALFGGRAWAESNPTETQNQRPFAADGGSPRDRGDGSMPGNGAGARLGGNMLTGSIIGVDSSTITVQTADGSTKIVLLAGSTSISLVTEGTASDLSTGEDVVVTGTTNDDGTVTAANIRLGEVAGPGGAPQGTPPAEGTATD